MTAGGRFSSALKLAGALALLGLTGCRDIQEPAFPGSSISLEALIVSNPSAFAGTTAAPALVISGGRAYASLPPGSVPGAQQIVIRNRHTGGLASAAIVEGGFDPIPLTADAGDTLDIRVVFQDGEHTLMVIVPSRRRPVVVRTSPPPGRRDVPLNSAIVIVFSEPVSPATLAATSVQLSLGGNLVAGTLAFGDSAHLSVTFEPAGLFASDAEYSLRLTPGIEDQDGQALDSAVTVTFRTLATSAPPPSITPPWGMIVSNPGRADSIVYVSMPPWNSFGARIIIENRRTRSQSTVQFANMGFDPVPVIAAAGDTLDLGVAIGADLARFAVVVPGRRPPAVVRSDPPQGRRDVQNPTLLVVFSEPIEPATLRDSALQLSSGGTPLAGTLAFGDSAHLTVTFTAAAPLSPGVEHTLLVTRAIEDLDGDALEAPVAIAFATPGPGLPPGAQLAFERDGRIYRVNSDGSGLVRLTEGPGDYHPAWSPDGRRIAFVSQRSGTRDIYIMDADGSNIVRRTSGIDVYDPPAWSPDNQQIAFAAVLAGTGSSGVYVMPAAGGGTTSVIDLPGWDAQPAWSPDGARIAFVSDWIAYDFTADVFITTLDGSQRTQVTSGFGFSPSLIQYYQPAWSPDGQRLAVVTCPEAFQTCSASTVAVMNVDGSGLRHLATTAGFTRPAWSPDGRVIAFSSGSGIQWVSADGTTSGVIVAQGESPSWRP